MKRFLRKILFWATGLTENYGGGVRVEVSQHERDSEAMRVSLHELRKTVRKEKP